MKYKINPLSIAKNNIGLGLQDLTRFEPGVFQLVNETAPGETYKDYYEGLLNGGDLSDGKEYRISKKAHHIPPQGIPIADRFIEFVNGDDIYLIEAPIMRVNQNKIINKTNVFGYEGTIKEWVALSDFMIDFTFYVYGKRRMELEYGEIQDFLDLYKLNESIPVNSPLLNDVYEIDNVVIESINNIQEHETYKNVMVINLTLSSDNDYEPFTKNN